MREERGACHAGSRSLSQADFGNESAVHIDLMEARERDVPSDSGT